MITIWGKPACPSCMKAKATCESRQLQYEYKELGKDFTREQVFEKFPGARTFPQIIVGSNITPRSISKYCPVQKTIA